MITNDVITGVAYTIIGIFGIVDLIFLVKAIFELKKIYNNFEKEIKKSQIVYVERMNPTTGQMSRYDSRKVWYDIGKLNENKDDYNEVYAYYITASQFVSVFPLIGILGTVMGIVFGGTFDDIETLYQGLNTALWTTLLGLCFAIVLKIIDLLWPGKLVSLIDSEFDDAESIIYHQIAAGEAERERTLRWTNQ
ncbi:MAG: MotA/TolQ/ExbB proton channel family protein [Butyrivibrio sp.]|uniref:MotA/TolQ/ExbB proton channel family protein n=1 Tax=Butyrivibrio sp. TaxID=28121 RepID=UPI0025FAEB17|nr:MotA/TolQ/ExbB proton channel family protein [Butyrivibrio sp.]MCR5769927.1 MotA/TolQ/ExbB proton channel family protein [Butyrivibrio sp.]